MTQQYNNIADVANSELRYGISIGRRQPMHVVHVDCIAEIVEAGLHPVIIIGSANDASNKNYNPEKNPLSPEQQHEQITLAMAQAGIDDYTILALEDKGHMDRWSDALIALLEENGIDPTKSAMHFRGKKGDAAEAGNKIKSLSSYQAKLIERGLSIWESTNRNPSHDTISATPFRTMDLLAPENQGVIHATLAVPEWVIAQAKAARAANPNKDALADTPITMYDLTLARPSTKIHGEIVAHPLQVEEIIGR